MKPEEFVLMKDNIPELKKAVAILYSKDNTRAFILYDEGEKKNDKIVLNIGEVIVEDEEVYVEDIVDKKLFEHIWNEFTKIYENLTK